MSEDFHSFFFRRSLKHLNVYDCLLNSKEKFQGKINKLVGMEKRESNPFIKIENGIDEFLYFHYLNGFYLKSLLSRIDKRLVQWSPSNVCWILVTNRNYFFLKKKNFHCNWSLFKGLTSEKFFFFEVLLMVWLVRDNPSTTAVEYRICDLLLAQLYLNF